MKDYDFKRAESHWAARWDELKIYRFDPASDREMYSIDTPPPTVSGDLHIGHCFSYTHADALARFWRMRGKNVFYPMGFDDNGLATERFVEKTHSVRAREMPRKEFIALCLRTVQAQERKFERLWRRLGLSVDWSRCYTTISPLAQKISQRSFLELYKQGWIYRKAAPTIWCLHCQTAIAQLDMKDELLRAGEQVEWVPDFMGKRYRHWVENLKWDWWLCRNLLEPADQSAVSGGASVLKHALSF